MILALTLFAGYAFRLWNLGLQSLWHDEAWSIFSAYHPLAWGAQGTDPNAPPIFYLSLGGWMQLVGDSVWALRYWSLLIGLVTVAVTAFIARRWFGDRAGIGVAVLVAFNPILWVFSQEIRAYVVMPLAAMLMLYWMDRVLGTGLTNPPHPSNSPRRKQGGENRSADSPSLLAERGRGGEVARSHRAWGWLLAVEIIALYSQNLAVPLVAWLNVTMFAAILIKRDGRKFRNWLFSQIVLGIAYLPWLLTQRPTGTPLNTTPPLDLSLIGNIWQSYFTGIKAMVGADTVLMILTVLLEIAALSGLILLLLTRRDQRTWLLLSQALLIPIFETAIIYAAHIDFHPRYYIVSVPATLLVMAAGLAQAWEYNRMSRALIGLGLGRLLDDRLIHAGTSLILVVPAVAIMTGVRVASLTDANPIYRHDDFRAIAERYAAMDTDDAIILPYAWEPTLFYYAQKMKFKARFITLPLYSSGDVILETLRRELANVKRAEFLTWYQLPADVRGAYPCILKGMGQRDGELTVQGVRTERFSQFVVRDLLAQPLPDGIKFGDFTLTKLTPSDSNAGVCLIGHWRLDRPTSQAYSLSSAVLFDPLVSLGKVDTRLLDDHQLPTQRWPTGAEVRSFAWIDLPPGLTLDNQLRAALKVYSDADPYGVDILRCQKFTAETCDSENIGKRAMIYFQKISTLPRIVQQDVTDQPLGNGTFVRKIYPLRSLHQGECDYVQAEIFVTGPNGGYTVVPPLAFEKRFSDPSVEAKPLTPIRASRRQLVSERICVPENATGTIDVSLARLSEPGGKIEASIPVGTIPIKEVRRVYELPKIDGLQSVDANFLALAILKGFTSPATVIGGQSFEVGLVWLAQRQTYMKVRVFVQLLDDQDRVIAQHDGEPVNGTRPSNWFAQDEYLTDVHKLAWSRTDYKGAARLIVGFYDVESLKRTPNAFNLDYYELPITVQVK